MSFNSKNDVLVCLVHLGYLAYDAEKKEVFIPTKEVRLIFEDTIQETDWKEVYNDIFENLSVAKYDIILSCSKKTKC